MVKVLKSNVPNSVLITICVFKETVEKAEIRFYGIGAEKEYNSLPASIDMANSSKNSFVLLRYEILYSGNVSNYHLLMSVLFFLCMFLNIQNNTGG